MSSNGDRDTQSSSQTRGLFEFHWNVPFSPLSPQRVLFRGAAGKRSRANPSAERIYCARTHSLPVYIFLRSVSRRRRRTMATSLRTRNPRTWINRRLCVPGWTCIYGQMEGGAPRRARRMGVWKYLRESIWRSGCVVWRTWTGPWTCCWCRRSASGKFDGPTPPALPSTGGKPNRSWTTCTSDVLHNKNIFEADDKFAFNFLTSSGSQISRKIRRRCKNLLQVDGPASFRAYGSSVVVPFLRKKKENKRINETNESESRARRDWSPSKDRSSRRWTVESRKMRRSGLPRPYTAGVIQQQHGIIIAITATTTTTEQTAVGR